MSRSPSRGEVLQLVFTAVIAFGACVGLLDRAFRGTWLAKIVISTGFALIAVAAATFWLTRPRDQSKKTLYREARNEILNEWNHVKTIAGAQSPALVSIGVNYATTYPYQDIRDEAERLRDETHALSRHFWRYHFLSKRIAHLCECGLDFIEEGNRVALHENAEQLDEELEKLMAKLKSDVKS